MRGGGGGVGGICIETSIATGSDEELTVRTESVRWVLPSPPFLPIFISLPWVLLKFHLARKVRVELQSEMCPRSIPQPWYLDKHVPGRFPHFKGALQKVKPDPPCVSLLQKWNSQTHSFIRIMKHYDSPGPVPGTRPPGGTSHSLCLKDLLAKVRKGTKQAHIRPEGKMKHRM